MDYDELVTKVIELLQREKRVPYRALKRRFDLDDEYIEDLKDELIYAKKLAVDEENRVLVWVGEQATTSPQTPKPSTAQATLPTVEPPPETRPREAERRQLTVMFCDLVDSTKLSSQLDPEDYREVVREYQRVCSEVIQRYDGHIAQYLGDGLLVYCGYPVAHEEDAQRAIHTGLGIVAAIKTLNTRLEQDKGVRLAVRLGIHTGLVVVGEMGGEGRQEQLALGETPNIAARIQGLAGPDTVVISDATYRLIQGYFECQVLGEYTLRGVAEPMTVYRALSESGVQSRLDVASTRGLTPLVGRESEVTLLLERWQQAKDGQGQVILLSGEAGIGKSRLVQVLKDHVTEEPHTRWECRSSPYYQNSALYPIIDLIQRTLRWQQDDAPEQRLAKLEQALSQYRLSLAETIPLFAPLLSLSLPEDRYPPLHWTPQRQRQKTLESTVAILLELAEREPVLFILEDLHWTDPTTLEFLGLLVEQVPTAAIYTLLTCRPEFQPSWHHRSYLTEITVNRLSRDQIGRVAQHVAGGKTLPTEIIQQLVDKTDGVPLYIEEMTKAVLESGLLREADGQYELIGSVSSLSIPTTLQDSLMARLDRLVTAKAVAQYAAVIGRQFSYGLLQAVSQVDEVMLQHELGRLVEAEIVYQRGVLLQSTYVFKHALIQDAAYQSLLKSTRQHYHQRIAQVLEARFPETAETQPELLAHHYTEAGLTEQAVHYWHHAGQKAIERSAHVEAIAHLRQGLGLLKTLPETPEQLQREVDMHIALGASLIATKGQATPEVRETYTRAQQLCERLEEPHQLFPALRGLWNNYHVRAEYQTAHELGEQLLTLAQQAQDPAMLVAAHRALGTTLFFMGAVPSAQTHFAQGIALYDSQQHRAAAFLYGDDAGVVCHSFAALTLRFLGSPDQGLAQSQQAVTLAQQTVHPFSLGFALSRAAMFHQLLLEVQAARERTEATIVLAMEQGFPQFRALGSILRGWALAQQGQAQEGITQITQGLRAFRAMGTELARPHYLALLAEAHSVIGQPEAGLTALAEALTLVDKTGERWYESEIYRLKGALLLQQSSANSTEAETCFHHAISIAQSQQAKSWELRAATSLAKLWQSQGKQQEAYDLLAPVYGWFTEGFDTADLKDAKILLDALASASRGNRSCMENRIDAEDTNSPHSS
jgi:TOMM system kinase/cyclase fusion protein